MLQGDGPVAGGVCTGGLGVGTIMAICVCGGCDRCVCRPECVCVNV
jgi:hypothetical protein